MSQSYSNIHHENKVVSDIFQFARHKKLQYHSSTSKASFCFELVHFDIWGPLIVKSIHGCRYFFTVLDDFSTYIWIMILKSKAEVSNHVQNFITVIKNEFKTCPKYIITYNGP